MKAPQADELSWQLTAGSPARSHQTRPYDTRRKAAGPQLSTLFPQLFSENPVIVIDLGDLSTPRSCSDFADRVMRHANTARDDVMGQSHQDSHGG